MKYAYVTPIYKVKARSEKKAYRPISVLFNPSKVLEGFINYQVFPYFNEFCFKF